MGAGPAGLVLACDLARRGVDVGIISASSGGFPGSRAKGVQPRTQEVLDDLGVLPALRSRGALYPKLGLHLGPLVIPKTMMKLHRESDAVPFPNVMLVAQNDTDEVLRDRLSELGIQVQFDSRLTALTQDEGGVTATVEVAGRVETIRARYVVGADGGASTVRNAVGIEFAGTTDDSDRMVVADLGLRGLSRSCWHIWPGLLGTRFMALCPMPTGSDAFQLMLKVAPSAEPELTIEQLQKTITGFPGARHVIVDEVRWTSVWRPNIRLAQHYRQRRVLLVGDAAHVHPPTGAQGLNTGIQDSYNLGWKLAQVLAGAPQPLLDSYEAERQPIAARVLGLSSELYASMKGRPTAAMSRGDEERQLSLSYRDGPLAAEATDSRPGLRAGDRMPGVRWRNPDGTSQHLFDHLRGPHFTLLAIGEGEPDRLAGIAWPGSGAPLRIIQIKSEQARAVAHDLGVQAPVDVLVRPDGYVAFVAHGTLAADLAAFAALALP
ncbi:FAD-dependent monooxygenase [Hamadaea flava]